MVVDAPADTTLAALGAALGHIFGDPDRVFADVLNGETLAPRSLADANWPFFASKSWSMVTISGPDSLREWRLGGGDFVVIGRRPSVPRCHSAIGGDALRIGDEASCFRLSDDLISATHAVVATSASAVFVADASSTNGTVLQGAAVGPEGALWRRTDELHVGQSRLRIASLDGRGKPVPAKVPHRDRESFDMDSGTFPAQRVFALPSAKQRLIPVPSATSVRARMRFRPGSVIGPIIGAAAMAMLLDPKFAAFALLSPVMLFINFLDDRRTAGRERRTGERDFASEFAEFRRAVEQAADAERAQRRQRFVDPSDALARAKGTLDGLWSVDVAPPASLPVRIGLGTTRFVPNLLEVGPRSPMVTTFCGSLVLRDVPVCVPLGHGTCVTFAGPSAVRAVQAAVAQLTTMVSPRGIAVMIDNNGATPWWAGLLPHQIQRSRTNDPTALVHELDGRSMILVQLDGGGPGSARERERLRSALPTVMFMVAVEQTSDAPPETTSLVENCNQPHGRLVVVGGGTAGSESATGSGADSRTDSGAEDVVVDGLDDHGIGQIAQALAGWHDPRTHQRRNNLRSEVSLSDVAGDVFETTNPNAAQTQNSGTWSVASFWHRAPSDQRSIVATIGLDGDTLRSIDLVGDGPHALVAGTTGAGKSELLRTLIVSLAIRYPPEIVTFVLIDYKGGSAFAECADLPHTVGFVTDLDEGLAARSLACLEAELRRRETMLRDGGARDLVSFASTNRCESLPRLVVVIDELAALVRDIPDFVGALISLAQRGRTLGLHLILATQRPAGTINDAIRANTNIRIALRVQDVADSLDVIADACAAAIDRRCPGQAFIRLGPGELESVQVASVNSASSRRSISFRRFEDRLVVTGTGTSVHCQPTGRPSVLPELVNEVGRVFADTGRSLPRRPWTDPLAAVIPWTPASSLAPMTGDRGIEVVIGIADSPSEQHQGPLLLDLQAGNVALIGPLGTGVTNAIRTVVLGLASSYGPDRLHLYVLDFLGGELSNLEALPHVGAVIGPHDIERRERFVAMLSHEIDRRRHTVERSPDHILVVCLDGWSSLRTAASDPVAMALCDTMQRLIVEGSSVGIRFVLGGDRSSSIPSVLAPSIAHRILFRPADASEARSAGMAFVAVGRVPGRALMAERRGTEVQVFASSDADIERLSAAWSGTAPEGAAPSVGILPVCVFVDELRSGLAGDQDRVSFDAGSGASSPWVLFIGLSSQTLAPASVSLRAGEPVIVAGPPRSGRTTALRSIAVAARDLIPGLWIGVLSESTSNLCWWRQPIPKGSRNLHTTSVTELLTWLDDPIKAGEAALVLIDNAERIDDDAGQLSALLAGRRPAVRIVVAGRADVLRTAYGHWTAPARRVRHGLILRPNLDTDGELWHTTLPRRLRIEARAGRGLMITEDLVEVVQVARLRSNAVDPAD